ncbi:MAG TPA: hypothetical protein VMJ10_22685 [Kofleriaceae bacterium]|nr:hypothetical protein [Kofleriaceae bacterium]
MKHVVIALAVVVAARTAAAYPQFQLSKDQTCMSCHISPSGGGLLNENGQTVAETISTYGTDPAFMYNKVPTPDWLQLGGDLRGAWGYVRTPQNYLLGIPMQADLYASAVWKNFRIYLTGGYQPTYYDVDGNQKFAPPWSREHYVLYSQDPGTNEGLFVRAGRFMPVFGLRFAEHDVFTREYGGTPLYGETYGVAIEYIEPKWEAHVTGFVKDPIVYSIDPSNGAAAYAEYRLTSAASVGAEGMLQVTDSDKRLRGGVTGKYYLTGPQVLLEGEIQFVNQQIDGGGAPNQLVSDALATWFAHDGVQIDAGLGFYDENIRIQGLGREYADLDVHWYTTSHFEAILYSRFETIAFGAGALSSGYVLLMGHYRL